MALMAVLTRFLQTSPDEISVACDRVQRRAQLNLSLDGVTSLSASKSREPSWMRRDILRL
jgi:hypothetical protein